MRNTRVHSTPSALVVALGAVLAPACATAPAQAPAQCVDEPPIVDDSGVEQLPEYFTVEIGAATENGAARERGASGGLLRAAGQDVADVAALKPLAEEALATGRIRGAAVLTRSEYDRALRRAVVDLLVEAGFVHIRLGRVPVSAPAPAKTPTAAATEEDSAAGTAASDAPAAPEPQKEEAPVPGDTAVNVETIGLHIGGGTNDDDSRQVFLDVLEQSFPELKLCYPHADGQKVARSFGVDLYVSASGGNPQIRATRTRIGGEGFQECVLAAYRQLEFPKQPNGPVVVSYSVRFEPAE